MSDEVEMTETERVMYAAIVALRGEVARLSELVAASREVNDATSIAEVEHENERMRATFQRAIDEAQASGMFRINFSGCEWCEEVWPKVDDQTIEETRAKAEAHARSCKKNPMAALREKCDAVVERMVRIHFLYGGHRVDNRGVAGCIWDAIELLAPDVADEIKATSFAEVYRRRYAEDDE